MASEERNQVPRHATTWLKRSLRVRAMTVQEKVLRSSQIVLGRVLGVHLTMSPLSFDVDDRLRASVVLASDDCRMEYVVMASPGHILARMFGDREVSGVTFDAANPVLGVREIVSLRAHRLRMLGIERRQIEKPVHPEWLGRDDDVMAALERFGM